MPSIVCSPATCAQELEPPLAQLRPRAVRIYALSPAGMSGGTFKAVIDNRHADCIMR